MHRVSTFVLTLGLVVLLAGSAAAQQRQQRQQQRQRPQGGGQGGVAALLTNESVQQELKMEKDQVDKVKEAVQNVRSKHQDDFAKLRDLSQEERRTKTQELNRTVSTETMQAVGDILKPEQVKRLKQIELQQAGVQAFTRPEVEKTLALTAEQKEKVKTISDDVAKEMRAAFQPRGAGNQGGNQRGGAERVATLRKESMEKVQAVLTDGQKKSWKDLTGDAFEVRQGRRRDQ